MVSYREVADLPVEELLSSADAPLLITPQTSVADAILLLGRRKQGAAVVQIGETEYQPVSLSELHAAEKAAGGDGSKLLVGSVVGHDTPTTIYQIPAKVTVAALTKSGSSGEVLLVTDPDGKPQAVLDRSQLALRIRGLVS
ncbi:hypothetical protein [Streptomyces sp. NPDC057253]|uniref:hypothetical protein n=1 Tax=Streptomyces sp. NPDC057253 TaxID=3346069 RepID=UPI003636F5A2